MNDGMSPSFESPAMSAIQGIIERIAQSNGPVLITGQSGTGKEFLARFIHTLANGACDTPSSSIQTENQPDSSAAPHSQSQSPFIKMDCAAFPAAFLERTLFGWKKGAFPGAGADHEGLLSRAQGGTLF